MAGLKLFTGNRMEILAQELAEVLRTPLPSPMDQELFLVQSRGMERWLRMELARRHGICANCRFLFPNHFAREIFREVLPGLPERTPFDREVLTWRIMKLLPDLAGSPGFDALGAYLGRVQDPLKSFQLSGRIADTFDQYLVFRPDMVSGWERGEEDHWQARLWRELIRGHEKTHRAALAELLLRRLKGPPAGLEGLPRRVSVFGISVFPGFHLGMLAGLSRFTDVYLFLMNPCREYWGDILSRREIGRKTLGEAGRHVIAEDLHMERGNSLLSSMGTLGRDFFDRVAGLDCEESSRFEDPGEGTLLHCIQSDILNLRERGRTAGNRKKVPNGDASIQIHSCHSPMREMEVLRDRLLHEFEKDPGLMPRDVLVMAPDIEAYAPFVQAVFDIPGDDPTHIPFSIADRNIRNESRIIEPFLGVLDLAGGRFGAARVLALLEWEAVRRRFDLLEGDMDLIRGWVKESRIRWGIDAESREKIGLPGVPENTWTAGLERLILGYALPGGGLRMFGPILPYDHVEGDEARILGNFVEFTHCLFSLITGLERPRTLNEWADTLRGVLDGLFSPEEDMEPEIQVIRQILRDLEELTLPGIAGFDGQVDIRVIRNHLRRSLEGKGFGRGFITGGVTFCAALPMRSIPFRMICLVGMGNDAYPRQSGALSFDLITRHPRKGDRSVRADDRYLFLETLLSARDVFYISYVGQSIQDNSPIPPSVLVSELMDAVEEGFESEGGEILDRIVHRHPLQAFNPAYFEEGGRLFSYSRDNFQAAGNLLQGPGPLPPFIPGGLSTPEESWRDTALEDLARFFGNPSRFLCQRRLGLYLEERDPVLEEREPFEVRGLERYELERELTAWRMEGQDLEERRSCVRASGRLPHGAVGESEYSLIIRGIGAFVKKTLAWSREGMLDPLPIDLNTGGFRVRGLIGSVYPERMLHYRYAVLRPRDFLRVWIDHLALNLCGKGRYPSKSMLAGLTRGGGSERVWTGWELEPLEEGEGEEIIGELLELFLSGLVRPLRFFPESSWVYAESVLKKRTVEEALEKAEGVWRGNQYIPGEGEDPYYALCLRGCNPLDSEFRDLAVKVLSPLMRRMKKVSFSDPEASGEGE